MEAPLGPPIVVVFRTALSNFSQAGWATKEDWLRHQVHIGQLYRKQPLPAVMDFYGKPAWLQSDVPVRR